MQGQSAGRFLPPPLSTSEPASTAASIVRAGERMVLRVITMVIMGMKMTTMMTTMNKVAKTAGPSHRRDVHLAGVTYGYKWTLAVSSVHSTHTH